MVGVFIPQELANAINWGLIYCLVDCCSRFKEAMEERLPKQVKLKIVYCL